MHTNRYRTAFTVTAIALGLLLVACSSSSSSSGSITLTGKQTTLVLGPVAFGTVSTQGIKLEPVSPATTGSSGGVVFPITGGTLKKATLAGTIEHSGGLKITATNGKTATLTNPTLDTASGILSATVNGTSVAVMEIKPLVVGRDDTNKQVAMFGTTVTLSSAFVAAINGALGVAVFNPSENLGAITIAGTYS